MSGTNDNEDRPGTPGPRPVPNNLVKDTPARPRSVHTAEFRGTGTTNRRTALLTELRESIPEYAVKAFMDLFLPVPTTNVTFDDISAKLVEEGVITEVPSTTSNSSVAKQFRLNHFGDQPANIDATEDTIFKNLGAEIFSGMLRAVAKVFPGLDQTAHLLLEPSKTPESDRKSRTRPDAHFLLKNQISSEDRCRWVDITCTGEFKKRDRPEDQDDNVTKMVFNLHHTMSLDPCRRFTFGFTIENTTMRLWFFSRSDLVISSGFNFIENPEIIIRFFLSMAFASKQELGWDETIERIEEKGEEDQYRICSWSNNNPDSEPVYYRTLKVLANYGADVLTGRGTRVYKVRRESDGKECVLKDVWMEDDREPEHVIYEKILNSATDPEDRRFLEDHLLKPIDYWMVPVDEEVEDHTKNVMMHGKTAEPQHTFNLVAKPDDNDPARESVAPLMSFDREPGVKSRLATRAPRRPGAKTTGRRHYRIVFEQVATPIYGLRKLSDVFLVLRDSAKILKIFRKYGWVHRDISTGNVYYHEGKGLLGDLEYTKQMGSGGTHEVITGTLDFMAAEVLAQKYSFKRKKQLDKSKLFTSEEALSKDLSHSSFPFEHNFGHDIESLFWLSTFILFFHRLVGSPPGTEEEAANRRKCTAYVFPGTMIVTHLHRLSLLHNLDLKEQVDWFCDLFKTLFLPIQNLYSLFTDAYEEFHSTLPEKKPEAFDDVCELSIVVYEKCREASGEAEIEAYTVKEEGEKKDKKDGAPKVPQEPESTEDDKEPNVPKPNDNPRKREYVIIGCPCYPSKKLRLNNNF